MKWNITVKRTSTAANVYVNGKPYLSCPVEHTNEYCIISAVRYLQARSKN